jgi:AcrR family transcriptional regulator
MSVSRQTVTNGDVSYIEAMPRVWSDTIAAHRRGVEEAILRATAELVAEQGVRAVTMSGVAGRSGIGRATLYKYFPGVEAILLAWHEEQIANHLDQLVRLRDQAPDSAEAVKAVLDAYAAIEHEHHSSELAASLHQGPHIVDARVRLHDFISDLVAEAARTGDVRDDVPPDELATYCLEALGAASRLPTKAAISRLVSVTLSGLRGA